jgi:hypothetical protein
MRTRDEPVATEIDAVTAWRGWSLVEEEGEIRLSSLTRAESWMPRAPHAASCSKGRRPTPQRRCRCGVYATTTPEALGGLRSLPGGVVGEVSLWGRVIEHGHGYRAEVAYPGRLGLVCAGCLAEGTGRRADVVQRLEAGGRMRLLPWCEEHAPADQDAVARDVESALLSAYAVDPVSDEMIERISGGEATGPARERSPRRRTVAAAILAAAIALLAIAALVQPGAEPSPGAAAGGFGALRIADDLTFGPAPRSGGLGNYPPFRPVLPPDADITSLICGRADGDVRILDCRADRVNAYVFATAPIGSRRLESCTERADAVSTRGDQTLCWRRLHRPS